LEPHCGIRLDVGYGIEEVQVSQLSIACIFRSYSFLQGHGKIHLATIFLKEVIQQSDEVLDDDAITDIIKTCNVIKNEKVQQSKRKSKGQAQKSKKQDKVEKTKAQKVAAQTFGDSNQYDVYDELGDDFEDAFF
jgi:translation initiation factor 3 subunit J